MPPSSTRSKSIEEITDEQLDRTFRTNIFGYFYPDARGLPHMSQAAPASSTPPRSPPTAATPG